MHKLLFLLPFLLSACSSSPSDEVTTSKATIDKSAKYKKINSEYDELVRKLKVLPSYEDVQLLKQIYVETSYYKPYLGNEQNLSQKMYADIQSKDWNACLAVSREILTTNFISINGHYGSMACSMELGKKQQGKYHRTMINFLLDDIWNSGNGRTPETAFMITSSTEMYSFLNLAGLEVLNQSLLEHEGKSYDRIGVRDPDTDDKFDLFFDISTQWEKGFKSIN